MVKVPCSIQGTGTKSTNQKSTTMKKLKSKTAFVIFALAVILPAIGLVSCCSQRYVKKQFIKCIGDNWSDKQCDSCYYQHPY